MPAVSQPPSKSLPQHTSANQYLRNRVLTATPEQLQMMLFDGAVRFAEQGRAAIESADFETAYHCLTRSQKIVLELTCGLRRDLNPDLCTRLAGIYAFAYRRLVEAGVRREVEPLDDALRVLRYQRETWQLLMDELARSKAAAAANRLAIPAISPDDPPARLSLSA